MRNKGNWMRVSLALSLMLGVAVAEDKSPDLIANFGKNDTGGKGNYETAKKDTSSDAKYGTDWTGSDSNLTLKTTSLEFTFPKTPKDPPTATNLVLKDKFSFVNQTDGTANLTLKIDTSKTGGLKKFIFGETSGVLASMITIGKKINLTLGVFTDGVEFKGRTKVEADSSIATTSQVSITGGLILGENASLKLNGTNSTLTNTGSLQLSKGASLVGVSEINATPPSPQAPLDYNPSANLIIKGDAKIQVKSGSGLTIKDQKLQIDTGATLSISSIKASGVGKTAQTLSFDTANGGTSLIQGGTLNVGATFETLDAKALSLVDHKMDFATLTSLKVSNLTMQNSSIVSTSDLGVTIDASAGKPPATPTFTAKGMNKIEATKITFGAGNYKFGGGGDLDFVAKGGITFANASGVTLGIADSESFRHLGLGATSITNQGTLSISSLNLRLFADTAITWTNISTLTMSGTNVEALNADKNARQDLKIVGANASSSTIKAKTSGTISAKNLELSQLQVEVGLPTPAGTSGGSPSTLVLDTQGVGTLKLGLQNGSSDGTNPNKVSFEGKSTPTSTLRLEAESVQFGDLSFTKLNLITDAKSRAGGLSFLAENASSKLVFDTGTSIKAGDEKSYQTLTFGTLGDFQSSLEIKNGLTITASALRFQNQNIELQNGEFKLYALGAKGEGCTQECGVIGAGSGTFAFEHTKISKSNGVGVSAGATTEVKLYTQGGALLQLNGKESASGLTLDGINLTSYKNATTRTDTLNPLDLSSKSADLSILGLTALEGVTIKASGIYTQGEGGTKQRGFGIGIGVGDKNQTGQLVLTDTLDGTDTYLINGNLTLDNTKGSAEGGVVENGSSNGKTTFDIQVGTSSLKKLSDQTLGLNIAGHLTAKGEGATKSVRIKAKELTFGKESKVSVYDTTLTLETKTNSTGGSSTPLDLQGEVYLEGQTDKEAILAKGTNGGNAQGLKLHNITAKGKASISDNLTFSDSTIKVIGNGAKANNGYTLKLWDKTASATKMTDISKIELENGVLQLKSNGSGNNETDSEVLLNAGGTIISSGDSKIEVKSLKAQVSDGAKTGLYALQVKNGTLTLQESDRTETQPSPPPPPPPPSQQVGNVDSIGSLTLGDEKEQKGGHLILLKSNGSSSPTYNSFTLKGDLKSYGESSLQAQDLTLVGKLEEGTHSISSTGGELKLFKKDNTTPQSIEINADTHLGNGAIGAYSGSLENPSLIDMKFGKDVRITSYGDSSLNARVLTLRSNAISVQKGTLSLNGARDGIEAGNVFVDSGVLRINAHTRPSGNQEQASLYIAEGSSITLSARIGYVNAENPLGGGVFGKVEAKSVEFKGDSKSDAKLVNVKVNASSYLSDQDDRLFALRAGAHTIIQTEEGIKKKSYMPGGSAENLTLQDVAVSSGEFSTLKIKPILEEATFGGQKIVKNLNLSFSVSQTKALELLESVENPQAKAQLQSLITSGNNQAIIDSILTTNNALKIGLAESIASGNVTLASQALFMINQSFANLGESIYAGTQTLQALKMIRHNNYEARMARKGNPFGSKNEVASLIQEASKYHYANNDDSLLIGLLDEPQPNNPFQGELWATYDGAINANQTQNATLNGMSAGYDLILGDNQEYLLGFALSYGYGTYTTSTLTNYSHNIGLGVYTRMFFGENEIDLTLSQNIGLAHSTNKLDTIYYQINNILNQDLSYNFYSTDLSALYGYSFKVGNEESPYYLKPLGGINFSFLYNGEAQGNGVEKLGMQSMSNYRLDIVLGMEMRKYLNEHTYFYLLPFLEKSLFNDGSDANIGFANALIVPYVLPRNNAVNLGIYAGGEGNITQGFALTGGIGAKMSVDQKEVFTNWNVGLRYRF
ncbi:hypothetical protein BBW65_01535 [Helicobacter enhydrae]|uniref:Autotransporter domain-containing protein n=1 Tax=Helicobacter enhydrae TaxID=222136 RepID=A0A1B1U489_9HELI|nr:autotransporter outer membrane beta-barrel domain-containing protein [Helicobacter enhydrae]ANV97569.1 hypothetical protein BBW65_01535 [Helicobacter enhydrae]